MNEKLEYLENKSRQNNIRIYRVREGAEGDDAVGFIKSVLVEKLEIPADMIHIVAAHRSPIQKPAREDATPRSFVVRFLQWNIRQKVLQAAWSKKEVKVGEDRIYFSQDFSSKIQKERSGYASIRRQLKEKNVKSHIIYPARLRVFGDGGSVTYNTLEDAEAHLQEQGILSTTNPRPHHALVHAAEAQSKPFQKTHN